MSNGVFGFGSRPMRISGFSDLDLASLQGQNLVAPYWADMDTTRGINICIKNIFSTY